jgi:hypothetical protein
LRRCDRTLKASGIVAQLIDQFELQVHELVKTQRVLRPVLFKA